MSAEELVFKVNDVRKVIIRFEKGELVFKDTFKSSDEFLALDRSEAHLLKLFLEEHLNAK